MTFTEIALLICVSVVIILIIALLTEIHFKKKKKITPILGDLWAKKESSTTIVKITEVTENYVRFAYLVIQGVLMNSSDKNIETIEEFTRLYNPIKDKEEVLKQLNKF